MLYTFGRMGAVIAMDVEDYRLSNHQRDVPSPREGWQGAPGAGASQAGRVHRGVYGRYRSVGQAEVAAVQAVDVTKSRLKGTRINRHNVLQMVRRRAKRAGLPPTVNCHSFRATGITNYLSNGGALEDARAIAAHESSQTTRLYDRSGDRITLDEIERIRF